MSGTGRYRVVRTIGRGGMAEVLEAIATGEGGFERRVAIKRMLPEFHDEADFATLFLDEARTASALHHANLVAVLDYGLADDLPFQVLEFVDGLDAERLFQMGRTAGEPMPIEVALYLCLQVAHALDYVHGARDANDAPLGIVHRDVSPSNVLVAWSGDVKLADFGIAIARTRRTETSAGVVRGKPAFMAPEQLVRGELDGRTDCFALACTLHALIVGTSPLARENAMPSLLAGAALELDPKLPDDVRAIVARSVRSAKSARHDSAAAMAREIADALARRGSTDSRGALQSWLAKVRPPPRSAAPRNALDALLMDEIVVKDPTAEVRRFVTVPAKRERIISQPIAPDRPTRPDRVKRDAVADPANRPTRPERIAHETDEPAERATRPERAPRANESEPASESSAHSNSNTPPPASAAVPRESKRMTWIAIGGAALALGAVGLGVQAFARRASSTASAAPPITARERPTAVTGTSTSTTHEPSVVPAAIVGTTTAPPIATPSAVPAVATSHTAHVENPHRAAHGATSTASREATPAPAPVTPAPLVEPVHPAATAANGAESATGVVALGGDGAQRAAIYIDDQARGFAPRALVLPVGTHSLRLVRPDGETLGPRAIEVLAQHTQSAPLRIRFP